MFVESKLVIPDVNKKWQHSGGRLGWQNWHHLKKANSTGLPPDQKGKQSKVSNLCLYIHWVTQQNNKEWAAQHKTKLDEQPSVISIIESAESHCVEYHIYCLEKYHHEEFV